MTNVFNLFMFQFGAPYIGASVPTLAYSPYLAGGLVSPLLGNDQSLLSHQQPGQPGHHPAQQQQQQQQQQQLQQQSKQCNDRIEVSTTPYLSVSQGT